MGVTMQQIADLVGVSRGTVDRALHGRGRIAPDVAQRILSTAQSLGYHINPVGQTLSLSRKNLHIGVILQSTETPTMQDVARGVRQAAGELEGSGIRLTLREISGLDVGRVLEEIQSLLQEGISALALAPNNRPELVARIGQLCSQGIPVITLNSDAPDSGRMCFVGMDNYRAGQTSAGLLSQILPCGGKVFIVAGHLNNTAHSDRLNGFLDALAAEHRQDIRLLAFQPCFDRDDCAHEVATEVLRHHPDLAAFCVTSHGQEGVCRAIEEAGLTGRVRVIGYDLNEVNRRLLQEGKITFVLDQQAFLQGYRPPHLLADFLLHGHRPDQATLYTDISIHTKYNLT